MSNESEIKRLIREFDFKNYDKKYNTDPSIVLSSICGPYLAEREIIRNGLLKKIIWFNFFFFIITIWMLNYIKFLLFLKIKLIENIKKFI